MKLDIFVSTNIESNNLLLKIPRGALWLFIHKKKKKILILIFNFKSQLLKRQIPFNY